MKDIEWFFKPEITEFYTDDFWYDLTDGGYIKPDDFLLDKCQIKAVNEAIDLLISFKEAFESNFGLDD